MFFKITNICLPREVNRLHSEGAVHMDLDLDNIMQDTETDEIKLIDFDNSWPLRYGAFEIARHEAWRQCSTKDKVSFFADVPLLMNVGQCFYEPGECIQFVGPLRLKK